MRIDGSWLRCSDSVTRPVIEANVFDVTGRAHSERFLVDCGADRTVLTAALLERLQFSATPPTASSAVEGIGGNSPTVELPTRIEFMSTDGAPVIVHGPYAAFLDPAASDMSLLGRDVLNHFDVILSKRRNDVVLLCVNHRYHITQS